jgi:hypothetical protein
VRAAQRRPPPPRRAGKRAQHRAQARDSEPSTERARAEHEVWGWWAHPQARRAEDGDRRSTAQHRAKRGHQDPGNGGRLSAFVAAVSQLDCRSCWGGDWCRWTARVGRRRGMRRLNAAGECGTRFGIGGTRDAGRGWCGTRRYATREAVGGRAHDVRMVLPGVAIVPARARRLQAAAGAKRR